MAKEKTKAKDTTMDDFMKSWMAERTEQENIALSNREVVFEKLKKLKIKKFNVTYQGSGDSGDFERPCVDKDWISAEDYAKTPFATEKLTVVRKTSTFNEKKKKWEDKVAPTEVTLGDAVQDIVYHLLEAKHPGWEINEGSDGVFTIDVKTQTISLEHRENETVQHHHSYEWS